MTRQPYLTFNDGHKAPQIGFGTWQIPDEDVEGAVLAALEAGYRHIDTARVYRNERGVGRAVRASGLRREEIFVTTKQPAAQHGFDETLTMFAQSAERLDIGYIDLYLIHWPAPMIGKYVDTFRAMIEIRGQGLLRSVGVSNFNIEHLERIMTETGVTPVVNQIELHPNFQQSELRAFHAANGIVTQSWSPLGRGNLWEHPILVEIGGRHRKSVPQVMLRWHVQLGLMPLPKSVHPERMAANLDVFDFELSREEMDLIATIHKGEPGRVGPHPLRFPDSR